MMKIIIMVTLLCSFILSGEVIQVGDVDFHYRKPGKYNNASKIMILFGGRNWSGDKTLASYGFNDLADRHNLFLLSPSFKDRNYWEPMPWSGKVLQEAIRRLENKFKLIPQKVYMYGYSAGGQCVALFYQWMPEQVAAWGIHACGVYPDVIKNIKAPGMITCGTDDLERLQISRYFVYRYREAGGLILWKYFGGTGHELSPHALQLAKIWFDDILSDKRIIGYGEDDTGQVGQQIETEFRNPLYSEAIKELWRK